MVFSYIRSLVSRLYVVFDKKSAQQAESEVASGFGRMGAAARRAGAMIAAAFSVTAIVAFGRSAIRAAVEAEVPWNRLSNTLGNVGIKFGDVERSIRLAARAMMDTSTMGDEQFAQTLDRLVSLSGDFTRSLENVPVVADIAAKFFNGELAPAADLVGRALAGNVRGFAQLGITTKDATKALAEAAAMARGAAQNELNTLSGRMKQLNEEMGELRENAGTALLSFFASLTGSESADALVTINRFRLGIQGISEALGRYSDPIEIKRRQIFTAVANKNMKEATKLEGELAALIKARAAEQKRLDELPPPKPVKIPLTPEEIEAAAEAARKAAAEREKARKEEISGLTSLFQLGQLRTKDIERAAALQRELTKELDKTAGASRRAELIGSIRGLRAIADAQRDPFRVDRGLAGDTGSNTGLADFRTRPIDAAADAEEAANRVEEVNEYRREREERAERDHYDRIEDIGVSAAYGIMRGFQNAFEILTRGRLGDIALEEQFESIADQQAELREQFAGGLIPEEAFRRDMEKLGLIRRELEDQSSAAVALLESVESTLLGLGAEWAARKAKENFIAAAEAFAFALGFSAHGNFTSASAAVAAGLKHAAVGTAYAALAGGAAAAAPGGGAVAGGGASSSGVRPIKSDERITTEINVFVDPFDDDNARHQDAVGRGVAKYNQREGVRINYLTRKGRS